MSGGGYGDHYLVGGLDAAWEKIPRIYSIVGPATWSFILYEKSSEITGSPILT